MPTKKQKVAVMPKKPMGWAAQRMEQFHQGKKATWWERRFLELAEPICFALTLFGIVVFTVGLWNHDVIWISSALAVAALGHAFCWLD